jgi:hypothetical protein
VALKIEGDEDCYGFANESYAAGAVWRQPDYRLPRGAHRIVAQAVSGEIRSNSAAFILRNDGPNRSDLWIDVPRRRVFERFR